MFTVRRPTRMRLALAEETVTGARVFRGPDHLKVEFCWRDWVSLGRPTAIEIEIVRTET